MENKFEKLPIQKAAKESANKFIFRFVLTTSLITAFLITAALTFGLIQKNITIVNGIAPYLNQLLRTNDVFDLTRQLNSLTTSGTFSAFWLLESNAGKIITKGQKEGEEFGFSEQTLISSHKAAWWIQKTGGFSVLLFSSYKLNQENKSQFYFLVTASPLPVGLFLLALCIAVLISGLLYFALNREMIRFSNEITHPITSFSKFLDNVEKLGVNSLPQPNENKLLEMDEMYQRFIHLSVRLCESEKRSRETEKQVVLGRLASQVAHDIRSPLAALGVVEKDLGELPEEKRLLIRSATHRIRDIANNLINQNRTLMQKLKNTESGGGQDNGAPKSSVLSAEPKSVQLISSILEPLLSEKRLEFRSRSGIEIESRIDPDTVGLFAEVQPVELRRVVSNLINNAVEALEDRGQVSVILEAGDEKIRIAVLDNGKGIPKAILPRLAQRGETHGKAGGSGLGLFHAKATAESWGGSLSIQSEEKKGTCISLTLPRASSPAWFLEDLKIRPASSIIILDDDSSIHQIWRNRFESLQVGRDGIDVIHFTGFKELNQWLQKNPAKWDRAIYLVDYELLGQKETGLDVIELMGIQNYSILVTSRFEDEDVRERCNRLRIRLLPKSMAGFVPVRVINDAAAGATAS